MSEKVTVFVRREELLQVMAALDAITGIPPIAPTNEQANLLNDFGIRLGSALLYGGAA